MSASDYVVWGLFVVVAFIILVCLRVFCFVVYCLYGLFRYYVDVNCANSSSLKGCGFIDYY